MVKSNTGKTLGDLSQRFQARIDDLEVEIRDLEKRKRTLEDCKLEVEQCRDNLDQIWGTGTVRVSKRKARGEKAGAKGDTHI